jgi:hypothetical protein
MDKDNDLDLIIDYINGELSSEEKLSFEERLIQDKDLLESFRIQKEIHQAFLRMQIKEQVQTVHQVAIESSTNSEEKTSYTSSKQTNTALADKHVLRRIAAVFISITFIGSLWTWFNHNSGKNQPIFNYVEPLKNDSAYTSPVNNQSIEKIDSNQGVRDESIIKRIDIIQINPDVSFAFGQKKEDLKNILFKHIWNASSGFNAMYRLNEDTLLLYDTINLESKEFLFEIQHDDESQSTVENGIYMMLDKVFYKLEKNNKLNKLTLIDNKSQVYELNKLIRKK